MGSTAAAILAIARFCGPSRELHSDAKAMLRVLRRHVLACFLAHAMWKTLAAWLKGARLGDALNTLLSEFAKINSCDIVMPAEPAGGVHTTVRLEHVSEPETEQKMLLQRLGLQLLRRFKRIDRPAHMERGLRPQKNT